MLSSKQKCEDVYEVKFIFLSDDDDDEKINDE
jgi:hypothetical protein